MKQNYFSLILNSVFERCSRVVHLTASSDAYINLTENTLIALHFYEVGQNSSDGIGTRYAMGGPGIECRLRRDFPHSSRPNLRTTQPPTQ